MSRKILGILLLMFGAGITVFSLLANHFGFDRDNNWGTGRVLVLTFGVSLLLVGLITLSWRLWLTLEARIKALRQRAAVNAQALPAVRRINLRLAEWGDGARNNPAVRWCSRTLISPSIVLASPDISANPPTARLRWPPASPEAW